MRTASYERLEEMEVKKANGVFYTPNNFATYVADKLIGYFLEDSATTKNANLQNIRIIDPACGDGELLVALWESFKRTKGFSSHLQTKDILCGVDLDSEAIGKTYSRTGGANLITANALAPMGSGAKEGWNILRHELAADNGFDLLIANPPWGADLSSFDKELDGEFSLKKGQFDSSDLFIELALSIVKPGGYFAFIIPDSLFSDDREALRALLLRRTELKFIGRFGEKIFEGINRACAVIICKNAIPLYNNDVDCVRLTPELRKEILSGRIKFSDAEAMLIHSVPQARFVSNRKLLLDIDAKEDEERLLKTIGNANSHIKDYLDSSRGVELSKSGKVCQCDKCHSWMPLPSSKSPQCAHCKAEIDLTKALITSIISKKKFPGSKPILVGESIKRYVISSRYWIKLETEGINYKDISLYYEPKILVRKTGVGITAAIDYSKSLTNQVVYIFRMKPEARNFPPLEFILAIMNSRVIYYYLAKKYGEIEWRSHPYLTQKQVLDLPLPNLQTPNAKKAWLAITKMIRPYLKSGRDIPSKVDARIESLIAELYGLTKGDYELIYRTLNSNQNLLPVQALKHISTEDIFK